MQTKKILLVLVISLIIIAAIVGIFYLSKNNPSELPNDFGFILKYGVGAKNVIDTFAGTFEKDLISAGTSITQLRFSTEELSQLYKQMQSIDILSYPSKFEPAYSNNPEPGIMHLVEPHSTYHLYLTMNGRTKEIEWKDTNGSAADKANELRILFQHIDEMIRSKNEYKRLPDAVGGYE